ncbi:MAG: GNAT family N-acetyltransferase [Lachnospiraceae bacterium]|nr:GNAT family N-acetyltransferase [Lachnospiraceae bacterium]
MTDEPMVLRDLLDSGCEAVPVLDGKYDTGDFPFTPYALSDLPSILEGSYLKDEITEGVDFIPDYLLKIHQRFNNIPWKILETERLIVRETTVDDVDRFYEIYDDPSTTHYIEPLFENRNEEIEYTKNYIEKVYGFFGYGIWTVINKADGKIIGKAGITDRDGFDAPEIGFVIASEYRRMGYAYEVCEAILDYAQKELGSSTIRALVKPQNDISIHLLENLGFTITRKLHQDYLIALRTLS